jgi:hypothetical protein
LFHPVHKLALVKGVLDPLPFAGKGFRGVGIGRGFLPLKLPKQALLFGPDPPGAVGIRRQERQGSSSNALGYKKIFRVIADKALDIAIHLEKLTGEHIGPVILKAYIVLYNYKDMIPQEHRQPRQGEVSVGQIEYYRIER